MFINFELTGVNFRGINVQPVPPTPTYYTITINQVSGGTITCDKTTDIEAGETITVTATPSSGYTLSAITVNGVEIEGNTFVMPAENVTVSAVFEQEQPVGLDYLTFTAQEANSTIKYTPSTVSTASYSTDKVNWQSFDNQTVTLANIGDKIYVKGVISGNHNLFNYANFSMTGKIAASGSVMSLQNENPNDTEITYNFAFYSLFQLCSSLTEAPELPATQLTSQCYAHMFNSCKSLTTAPELPANYLVNECYMQMFLNCTSLTSVKHNIIEWKYLDSGGWLYGVAATGTVYCPAASTIPSDSVDGIPKNWNRIDL